MQQTRPQVLALASIWKGDAPNLGDHSTAAVRWNPRTARKCAEITDFVRLGSFGGLIGAFWKPQINRAFRAYQVAYQRVRTWVFAVTGAVTRTVTAGGFRGNTFGNHGLETAHLVFTSLFTMHLLPAHLAVTMLVTSSLVTIEKMRDSVDAATA